MPSPTRRSARAAPTPSRAQGTLSASSSSSITSSRHDRKANGATKSATPHSRTSEDASEPPRRSQRSHTIKDDSKAHDTAEDDGADDEEITRCVCECQEYPGPPMSEAFQGLETLSDDIGGLFIQCDGCSVWQHGGCVGIVDESQSPDKYYCEECRPKFHELHVDARGQKYSSYRPLQTKTPRKPSMSKSDEKAKKEREALLSRASTDPVTGKRRVTMRSKEHDDEEEQLRQALEESRREVEGATGSKKSSKRGRDDSEESKSDTKRLRVVAEPASSLLRTSLHDVDSDADDADLATARSRKIKQDPSHSMRQAEQREREAERERMRQDAAGRRQERAGRRRIDGELGSVAVHPFRRLTSEIEPFDDMETLERQTTVDGDLTPRSSQPPSPPPSGAHDRIASLKKGSGRKAKKSGNNQYTKARDLGITASPHFKRRDTGVDSGEEHTGNMDSITSNGTARVSPPRETNGNGRGGRIGKGRQKGANGIHKSDEPVERTIANMKRSLDMMMTYVARQQIDMAGDKTPVHADTPRLQHAPPVLPPAGLGTPIINGASNGGTTTPKAFEQMTAMEMADVFSRNVQEWNTMYGYLA